MDRIMKNKLRKYLYCVIFATLLIVPFLVLGITSSGERLEDNVNNLLVVPIICGLTVGHIFYKISNNKEKIKNNPESRSNIIVRTSIEATLIFLPLYYLAMFLKLIHVQD